MLRSVTMGFTDIWILIAALVGIVTIPQEVNGVCHYQGQLFANNTSWKPDSCQDCICARDIVICRTSQCLNPQCDFQKGEILRILPNKCCPECVLQSQDSCHYEGSIYGHGSQWNGSRCSLCTCSQGTVSCNPLTCRPLNCGKGQTPSTLPGECCPQCLGSGASCSADGLVFRDGGQWYPSPCMKCVCSAGETQCFVAECQPMVCQPHENLVVHPGKCCPQCEPDSCLVAGTEYKHGEQWLKNSCTTCRCDHGQERCHTQTCPPLTCKKGQNAVKRAGQCCEDCVSPKGTCVYQGMARYHGDMWNITGCEFCTCDRGQVLCRKADCGTVKCSWGEELVHFPGKCCPECRSVSSNCVFKQQTYQNLEHWNDGPCRQCECRDSHAACYQRSCPTCRPGSLAVARPGECCPECHTAQCYAECLTCSQSPDHCDSCKNPQAVLHEGRCLPVCPSGFYQNGRVCTACPRSCAACENPFECTSCSGILLMSRRQCVSTCERGFYQDHGQCSRCHDSCSSCHGPTPQDCLSCSDPSHLLKDGLCVGACGPGFYTKQGTCYACDSSCLTCHPDNPSCASCSPASALHHGKCVPHCPEQHYRDGMAMCRVCHSSCAACAGPSVAHCSRCHPPLSLHLGQCVDTCGEGLYAQDGHCQSCHASCRSCMGPSHSDCTRCLKPEEVLQLEPGQAARGVCASSCTDRFYLDTDQTCKGCHATCQECTHGSHLNCTACSPVHHLHQGQCLQRCPQGFYSQDRACHACHPSCRRCSGPSDADCTACLPHAELQGTTCLTSCPQGQYITTLGQCTGCHESCQRCVADPHKDGSICLWCQDPRTLLLGGHCVSHCPPGHYSSLGACKRCHISCQSCSSGGPSSCTSCPPPMVLSPSGLCTQLCPLGYYADVDRVCHACDIHCLTCEMAGICTSCRDPAKVLLFGECQYESCAHQYYLDFTTRACRECDWSCNVCKGPLHTDCLQCMEGSVLQGGVCAQGCAAGFYQDGETCLSCDAHCQECQGSEQCLRCQGPFVLLRGRCLHACGRGYFLDSVRQQCAECPENCVECEGIRQCKVCKESSFLKKGLCTADCGRGFYADTRGRHCRENHHAPVIHANGSLLVEVGGTAALDVSFMTAQDPDGDTDSMIFRVIHPPTNGHLFHIMDGRETRLKKEDTFSFSDFKDRAVRFTHAKGKSKSGHFTLLVTDQQLFSAPETINIQAVSFQAPYILTSEPLLVNKGEKVFLTSSVLQIQDDDNPEDVLVVVRDPPQHGHLSHLLHDRPLQQFRLDDLVQEQLYYVHDGSDGPQDTLLLQISDGYSYQNLLVHVNVAKMNVTSPLKPSNPTLWVGEGGMAQITSAHLGVKNKTSSDLKTLYTVVPSKERPRYGKLVLLVPMPADGPADGLQQLPDGRASLSTTSFSQRDVDVGAVWYQRFARGAQRDGFDLWVSSEDGVLSDSRSFEVGVVSETPGFPRLAAGATLHVTALEDRTTVITASALSFVDMETPSENLVYDITVPLTHEQGTIEHKDRPYKPVYVFTQLDIDGGKIIYRPPSTPPHLQELYPYSFAGLPEFVTFNFTVSDGERTTPPIPFAIHLLANHQQPPVFQILDPVLEVSLGGRAPIGVQQLDVTDADTAPDDLEFLLEETPQHGTLLKVDGGVGSEMVNGDAFSFSDITRNVLQYEHAGITTENDAIVFTVTDGSSEATVRVQVLVMEVKGDGPERDPDALLSMEVPEKSSTVITRSHLAYVDNKSPDEQIRFQIVSTPMYGILTRTDSASHHKELTEYSIFSMEDINDHSIRYVTSFETGNQPITDIFHFIVYDGENNRLDGQMYTITITPVLKRPPVVTVHGDIKVEEGGRVHLSANHIIVSDLDTPKKELLVWLTSPPKYGFIENTNQAGETGGAQIISPEVPFSVEDLMSDHIVYVQNIQQIIDHHHDEFSFYISDGYTQTEAFNININIQQSKEEKTPLISVSNIPVDESSGVVITNSSLMVLGRDLPGNEVIFTVTKKPSYGKIRRRQSFSQPLENGRVLSQGSTFTYQDVLDKLLGYTPDSLTRGTDEVHFSVTDGVHTETCQLEFTMDIAKSEGPRVATNRGLQLTAGSTSQITDQHLKGVDKDSDDLKLRYVITKDPTVGELKLTKNGVLVQISVKGPITSFTQEEINKGFVQYQHEKGEKGGSFLFKFNLIDPEGNKVIDQSFFISVLEDRLPPSVVVNKGLVLDENTVKKITTLELSATDHDSEPGELVYRVTKQPQLGHLEYVASPGTQIRTFTQADLASRKVQYIHTSEEEKHADDFTFTVSDGVNEVSQTFYITIRPVDDSLPVLQMQAMRVQEGVRKTITEFELKATDADTEEEFITFTVVQAPRHGTIERTHNGQNYRQTSTFTMDDVYQNRISYNHDGSNSLRDRFTFTITDGANLFFLVEEEGKEVVTVAPQKFRIEILPVDDGTPRIVTNLGLHWLEYMDNKATNLISKKELLTMDPDTEEEQLVYEVTVEPKHGFLETKLNPGSPITSFTQADINLGLIRYVLNEERIQETMDNFKFLVKDSKPNVVTDNVFHIQWSLISFEHASYNVSEQAGTVAVTVKRTGNLNQYSIVLCRTEQGTATSTSSTASRPGQQDYVEYAGQVQFDEREDTKLCTIMINDDQVFENIEMFSVELSMPAYALLGPVTRVKVHINDTEDEPTLQFDKKIHHVNESAGLALIPIERKGDTSSTASALCYSVSKSAQGSSLHALQSGSDFKSRGISRDNRVIFGPGVSMSSCDVRLIDDSEYELSEEFELVLSDPSDNARIGDVSVAKVVIDGPNDASKVFLGNSSFTFSEDAGTIEIPVHRHGSDLASLVSVWCATRPSKPPSATPGVDYIPSSKKIEFKPGKTVETCSLSIMDDIQNPAIEGSESFVVFLSSAQGAVLTEPFEASVIIEDTVQDIPQMQLEKSKYTVKEKDGILHIPIIRTGDLTLKSSVRCYTRTMSAMVMDDFEERTNTDSSRIIFHEGEKVKNCTVQINDDSIFEPEEEFQVHLGSPQGDHWTGAMVGIRDVATVTITNDEDAPTIEFEEATYQVREPPGLDGIEVVTIKVIRKGDQNRLSKVRCSTRDGSAQSGVDYNPKSRVLKFNPGMDHVLFKVEILSSEDREWHESFSVVLGPDDPVEAVLGEITVATVTVLDQEAAGSLILPAPPIVVSLSDYDYVQEVSKEENKKSPSPGYPLICVTPCDPHYPKFFVMRERCEEAGINQSSIHFSWEVAAPTDANGARSPFETVTDNTPFTSVNHKVLDSIYFSRRFHVRCVAQARDKAGHLGTPLRSNIVIISTEGSICHTPVTTGTARGFQAQSFVATLKYLDVKHKEHPNRIHITVQIPHQDGMFPLVSTLPLHNLHFLLSESIYRHQHICSNLVTLKDLEGISEAGFLEDVAYDSISLGPGYDRPYQFNPDIRESKTIQLYKHLNLKNCIWTFEAYYDMTELIDVCGGTVTADFQVRDSTQSFLTVQVPLYVSYIYVTAPRGWASLEHHTEMEFSFFYDTILWRTGIQTDSVLSARLQILRIYIREDGRLVIEFKTHAKFRGHFVLEHHTLPGHKSQLLAPDPLGGMHFDLQLLWSAQTFDSPYQLWRATSSYSRKDYSGEYTAFLVPCTVQPTQPWIDPGDKPLSCTAHAPEKFLVPIAFQQTNRPVPVVYSLNTEFQLCNNEKIFMMDPAKSDVSMAEMDYKGAFSMGQTLYGRVLWNPEQNLNAAYKLQLEKVYLCTGRDGYVPYFDPTGTLYNEGPQYGCIQPNKHLKHRFLLLDRKQPEVCDRYFHDVPFEASFASDIPELHPMTLMPGVDGFTVKVDALYKVEAGHQWYLQVIYVIGPESISGPRIQRSLTYLMRDRRDLVDRTGRLTLDESLIYDNEGDQVKNGTNMKTLRLDMQPSVTFSPQADGSLTGGLAAASLLLLVCLASCFLLRKCRRKGKKLSLKNGAKEYPLNTKVEVFPANAKEQKNFNNKHCTVTNVNILNKNQEACKVNSVKVKQVNLEVKLHNNLNDGTEV